MTKSSAPQSISGLLQRFVVPTAVGWQRRGAECGDQLRPDPAPLMLAPALESTREAGDADYRLADLTLNNVGPTCARSSTSTRPIPSRSASTSPDSSC